MIDRPATAPPTTTYTNRQPNKQQEQNSSEEPTLVGLDPSTWPTNYEELFKAHTDWQLVSQSLSVLSLQAERCERDLENLLMLKEEAMNDPEGFLEKFGNDLPVGQKIARVPWVNPLSWASGMRTRRSFGASCSGGSVFAHNQEILVRRLEEIQSKDSFLLYPTAPPTPILHNILPKLPSTPLQTDQQQQSLANKRALKKSASENILTQSAKKIKTAGKPPAIDGKGFSSRPSTPSPAQSSSTTNATPISATHNLAWTEEEKAKLNDLLIKYPEEPIPSRRWAKIAAAMGTRTATQIASRIGKLKAKRERLVSQSQQTHMDDSMLDKSKPEYLEYKRLEEALEKYSKGEPVSIHTGIKCDGCKVNPIIGSRWSCSCSKLNLCERCRENPLPSAHRQHSLKLYPLAR